ncbi:hypothetical protein H7J87_09340 [Mycolicibacterium wolinskyi]|uniref:Secreted protein n=1 Tax=Mycolicibacterium wolinskyi TaxID=59750 RepID=A0A1X2FAM6_9MYCO|nr:MULTISPECIES: hypothetical protein [Mycolicibacterium]MCV7285531.1 hypothetical protein [Mycolicibacterium wolinskyi]MCV7291438.1 hypothetical protein [Mycolicibacterium goodii]ORX15483.1 hypothetical protein AWC31_23165 [Mycolicibacterium wolinskyi]
MRRSIAVASVVVVLSVPFPAHADDRVLHQVTYTVTAESPVTADIYYREADPPTWAEYSHNPYVFSPKAEVRVGPGQPWVLNVMLADPDRWAMVSATSGRLPASPMFRCELAVDGVVITTGDGPKGALCALRHW